MISYENLLEEYKHCFKYYIKYQIKIYVRLQNNNFNKHLLSIYTGKLYAIEELIISYFIIPKDNKEEFKNFLISLYNEYVEQNKDRDVKSFIIELRKEV